MSEKLYIKNFAGIRELEIETKNINILIGEQATGKSVTIKLFYFFKSAFENLLDVVISNKRTKDFVQNLQRKFKEYFPVISWSNDEFLIRYEYNDCFIEIKREDNKYEVLINYSKRIDKIANDLIQFNEESKKDISKRKDYILILRKYLDEKLKEEDLINLNKVQIFIPAGRSFFANVQKNIFSLISQKARMDPFILEFGSFYEFAREIIKIKLTNKQNLFKKINEFVETILKGKYMIKEDIDYIITPDKRTIELSNASSGQQELLPLLLTLKILPFIHFENGVTIYIEEPEAHLFPVSQKLVVELIATVFNKSKNEPEFFITTHSPYILTSFNNLLQAGEILEKNIKKKEELYKIIPEEQILKPGTISAYSLKNGTAKCIINKNTGLILADIIDEVSEEISIQFEKILDLEND